MSRLIDADALEREGWILHRTFQKDTHSTVYETKKPSDFLTIEPERMTGKWINQDEGSFYPISCSNCHKEPLLDTYGDYVFSNYCPHCGADMREGEKE